MYYPHIKRTEPGTDRNLAIEGFGHRIHDSQTLYEYVIEFLIIFCSPKSWGTSNSVAAEHKFPSAKSVHEKTNKLHYSPTVRMGLKRFVFFERSKQENRFEIDKQFYADMKEALRARIHCSKDLAVEDVMSVMQDLIYGFNAVVKNRAWFAQALLPVCPELALCEAMGSPSKRKRLHVRRANLSFSDIDGSAGFQFHGHYFLARGGEVYFLHILRGLSERPELTERLEQGLAKLVRDSFPQLSWLALWVEDNWLESVKEYGASPVVLEKTCEWVPEGYAERASLACMELVNLLEAELPNLQKLDLLAKGIVLQILRMMSEQACTITEDVSKPEWIIDIASKPGSNVRKYAAANYRACEEYFTRALDTLADKDSDLYAKGLRLTGSNRVAALREGARFTLRLFRKLGKDLGLVVPPKGAEMRFTLNEGLVQFLVLSLVAPGHKVLLSDFLSTLRDHYGMIIGPAELSVGMKGINLGELDSNRANFQELLKRCGFLKDLSDATSIVENPFGGA